MRPAFSKCDVLRGKAGLPARHILFEHPAQPDGRGNPEPPAMAGLRHADPPHPCLGRRCSSKERRVDEVHGECVTNEILSRKDAKAPRGLSQKTTNNTGSLFLRLCAFT